MVSLLDVNVLVALFDPAHVHHDAAHDWFAGARGDGWATCPLTENGLVRILSSPAYPGSRTSLEEARRGLCDFRATPGHRFWPEELSICDGLPLEPRHVAGSRQLTDCYLLALAARRGGRLATFDRRISTRAVPGAGAAALLVLSG